MRPASLIAVSALLVALAAAPQPAAAQSIAYSVPGSTNVRAGPGTQFPVVARVRGGVRIVVFGCLTDRAWCDVQVYRTRGWMSSRRLEFVYAGSRVLVPDYYDYFDAPIIRFDFGYWDRNYDDRPFYRKWRRDRDRRDRPSVHNAPPPEDATNFPGIERPPGEYEQNLPQAGNEHPPIGAYDAGAEPPVSGYDPGQELPPDGGYDATPPSGAEQVPGNMMPEVCPPDVVCQ